MTPTNEHNVSISIITDRMREFSDDFKKCTSNAQNTLKTLSREYKAICQRIKAETDFIKSAEKELHDKQYNAIEEYVHATIIDVIPVPSAYDHERVRQLRQILANTSTDTLADRIAIIAALHELKLYIGKFPLLKRVDTLIKEWTGKSFISNDEQHIVHSDYRYGIHLERCISYYDMKHGMHKISIYNEDRVLNMIAYDYWEQICGEIKLNIDFILDNQSAPVKDWLKNVRYIGRANIKNENHRVTSLSSVYGEDEPNDIQCDDVILATLFVVHNPSAFTLGQVIMVPKSSLTMYVDGVINDFNRAINSYAFRDKINDVKLIRDTGMLTWRNMDSVNDEISFNPDTCELNQPNSGVGTLDMRNARLSNLIEYATKYCDGLSKYGTANMIVEFSDKSDVPANIGTLWDNLLHETLRDQMSVSVWYGDTTRCYANLDPGVQVRFEFQVALKCPINRIMKDRETHWGYKTTPVFSRQNKFMGVAMDYDVIEKYRTCIGLCDFGHK